MRSVNPFRINLTESGDVSGVPFGESDPLPQEPLVVLGALRIAKSREQHPQVEIADDLVDRSILNTLKSGMAGQ